MSTNAFCAYQITSKLILQIPLEGIIVPILFFASILTLCYSCDLYLAPSSTSNSGRGIFMGQELDGNEVIGDFPSILINRSFLNVHGNMLYTTPSSLDPSMEQMSLGFESIVKYNYKKRVKVERIGIPSPSLVSMLIDGTNSRFISSNDRFGVISGKNIQAGDEIFISYDKKWISDNYPANSTISPLASQSTFHQSIDYLEKTGQCLSDVFVDESKIRQAGRGLFARKSFNKGDVMYVSPAMLFSKQAVDSEEAFLLNYCLTRPESDVAILPLGFVAMVNHQPANLANAELFLFDWKSVGVDVYNGTNVDINSSSGLAYLASLPYPPIDIAIRATREISASEEITISYGVDWESKWLTHLENLVQNRSVGKTPSLFRQPIEAEEGWFPTAWSNRSCIGKFCPQSSTGNDDTTREDICHYYLAPSKLTGAGRGVFAGRNFSLEERIEESPVLLIRETYMGSWRAYDYVYQSDFTGISMMPFGAAMFFNHNAERFHNAEHYAVEEHRFKSDPTNSWDTDPHTYYETSPTVAVEAGDELFTRYGGDEWFFDRKISYSEPPENDSDSSRFRHSLEFLATNGVCISHVYVDKSKVSPLAGRGLFAKKNFRQGELIYVSPVLIVPKHEVLLDKGLIVNYILADDDTDIAILQLGLTSMMNHQPVDMATVNIEWFDWTQSAESGAAFRENITHLMDLRFAPLDFAYRANRDIAAGEELTIFYGSSWSLQWAEHLADVAASSTTASSTTGKGATDSPHRIPPFRVPIRPPPGLFPASWYNVSCAGFTCRTYPPLPSCEIYLAPAAAAAKSAAARGQRVGRAVYAGRNYPPNAVFTDDVVVRVKSAYSKRWSLSHYTYNTHTELETLVVLGVSMMLNHHSRRRNLHHYQHIGKSKNAVTGETDVSIDFLFNTTSSGVSAGEELLVQYGDETWFTLRGLRDWSLDDDETDFALDDESSMESHAATSNDGAHDDDEDVVEEEIEEDLEHSPSNQLPSTTAASLDINGDASAVNAAIQPAPTVDVLAAIQSRGICMSDLYWGSSSLAHPEVEPIIGDGIFARRSYRAGDLIYVSPVLVLPKHEVIEEGGDLINYCLAEDHGDVALLPIGLIAAMNHQPELLANVEIEWFDWADDFDAIHGLYPGLINPGWPSQLKGSVLRNNLTEAMKSLSAPFDIAYRAKRDISIYEELTFYYGPAWEAAHKKFKTQWAALKEEENALALSSLKLRQFIRPPKGLFPDAWAHIRCLGMSCPSSTGQRSVKNKKLNKLTRP